MKIFNMAQTGSQFLSVGSLDAHQAKPTYPYVRLDTFGMCGCELSLCVP